MQTQNFLMIVFIGFLSLSLAFGVMVFWRAAPQTDSSLSFWNGQLSSAFEKKFDDSLAHRPAALAFWNRALYSLFGEGRKGVVIGNDGTLYTDEEFSLVPEHQTNFADNLDYILSVFEQLKADGINVFIVPVPSKARVMGVSLPSYREPVYAAFTEFLTAQDIPFVDTLSVFQSAHTETMFLRTDTHWSPDGAKRAAFAAAATIERAFPYVTWERATIRSSPLETLRHEGDLSRYTIPKTEPLVAWQTTIEGEAATADDLFSDVALPVTLIGTSYSSNLKWNFAGFLKEGLGTDLLNLSDEGLGPFQVMQTYMKDYKATHSKPKILIWEIPERYLPVAIQFEKSDTSEIKRTKNEKNPADNIVWYCDDLSACGAGAAIVFMSGSRGGGEL